jgi:hypothetical protein
MLHARKEGGAMTSDATMSLRIAMRKLWADHIIWTRQYIVAAVDPTHDKIAKLPEAVRTPAGVHAPAAVFEAAGPVLGDAEAAAGRLLKNQEDIGNAIVPYYGHEAGAGLTKLLKEHIMIAVDLIAAAIADDKAKFAKDDARWTANANEIAAFLSGANLNWTKGDLADLLGLHLSLTKKEVVARLGKKWDDDIAAFDDIFTEINTLSDALCEGIVKQFPARF